MNTYFIIHILIILNIYIILCVGTNLLVGMTNLLSLAQAAFYGIGAYIAAWAFKQGHLSLIPTVILVVLGCIIVSWGLAKISMRLKGDYFVLATLGIQLIFFSLLYNSFPITNGSYGIGQIPRPQILGYLPTESDISFLIMSSLLTGLILFLSHHLINSPFGRILRGMRENEFVLQSLGKRISYFRTAAFVVSSSFCGIGGMLYASYVGYIDPTSFDLQESFFILMAVLIGGTGNIKGSIAGAIFVIIVPEILRSIGFPDSSAAHIRQIMLGLLLIIIMRIRPQGLWGSYSLK